jgi:hypothetical protein
MHKAVDPAIKKTTTGKAAEAACTCGCSCASGDKSTTAQGVFLTEFYNVGGGKKGD